MPNKDADNPEIVLRAIFQAARTTVDGGIRISFDIDASQADLLAKLLKIQQHTLYVVVTPETPKT
jgi:hypothetical protein